jgi:hypothetical protein
MVSPELVPDVAPFHDEGKRSPDFFPDKNKEELFLMTGFLVVAGIVAVLPVFRKKLRAVFSWCAYLPISG